MRITIVRIFQRYLRNFRKIEVQSGVASLLFKDK